MSEHPIPFEALDGKVGILGATGTGKSFTSIGQCERLLDDGQQVIVVDPTGAYSGLRTAFPIPIFGGKFGDFPIAEGDGERIAQLIIDMKLSAIVDVSLLLKHSRASARRFMGPFVAALKNAATGSRYLVMDEADEFMPEHASGGDAPLFGDLKWLVRRGRIEGWRMLMVTQRPQDIAKSVLTQCETLIVHRLPSPQDRKAVEEWVKGHAEPGQAKAVLQSLASLETGEAWVWAPRHNVLVRAMMPANRSEDRSKTPDAADVPRATHGFQAVDVGEIAKALSTTSEALSAAAKAPSSASSEVADLKRQLQRALDDSTIEQAVGQQQMDALIAENRAIRQIMSDAVADLGRIKPALEQIPAQGGGVPRGDEGQAEGQHKRPSSETAVSSHQSPRVPGRAPAAVAAIAKSDGGNAPSGASGKPTPAALAIADLLDRVNPARLTWSQAATMTKRKATGGNFNAARKWLRESGRIAEDGDFIRSAQPPKQGMTRTDALDLWKSILTSPAPRMIDALYAVGARSKDELGEMLNCAPRGGNFNNGVAQLVRNGVAVNVGGKLRLADPLPGQGN